MHMGQCTTLKIFSLFNHVGPGVKKLKLSARGLFYHFTRAEWRHSKKIQDQSETKPQQYKILYGVWDLSFKGLRWPSPTSFAACTVHLSRADSTPYMQFSLAGISPTDIANILGSQYNSGFTFITQFEILSCLLISLAYSSTTTVLRRKRCVCP